MKVNGAKAPAGSQRAEALSTRLRGALEWDSAFWRRTMVACVTNGPEALVRYSPPLFGWAFGAALGEQRRAVRNSLRMIHGQRSRLVEMRDVAEVFANFASSMTDAMVLGTRSGYRAINRPINDDYVQSSIALGKGVILATAQTAGWDVVAGLLSATTSAKVMVVMESEADPVARDVHDATRVRDGVRVVHVGSDPLSSLPLLRHLRGGGVVALKFDRVHEGMRTLPVTFFGRPWQVPAGPLRLSALSGAPIIPCFTRRLGFLEYQPINCEPIRVDRHASHEQQVQAAQRMTNGLESFVRAHPTHWIRFQED